MTANEMLNLWKVGFEVFASNSAPGFEDSDIFILLNRSQDLIIEELVTRKDWLRLQKLVLENSSNSPSTQAGTEFKYISLPSDYQYYVNSYSIVDRTGITNTGFIGSKEALDRLVKNIDITVQELDNFYTNGFNQISIFKNPKACVRHSELYIVPDSYTTIKAITLRYVRKRLEIGNVSGTGDCELDESLHRLIVEKAIDLAKKIIFIQEPQSSNNQ